MRGSTYRSPVTGHRSLFWALLLACAGCGRYPVVSEANYLTFEHEFTDAAIEEVRTRAVTLCAQKTQLAVRTSRACSLNRCTTNYECMDDVKARQYQP